MTDDQTRPMETPSAPPPAPAPTAPTAPPPASPPPAAASAWAAEPAATQAVAGASRDGASAGRGRWLIALGVAGIAIALTVGAVMLLAARPVPEALRYVPGNAVLVAEVRMDLPGDQMQHLGNFLSRFPGFADQSTLPDKIDEALSQVVGSASGGEVDYEGDLKPWLNGPTFVGVVPDGVEPDNADFVISATTNGGVDCSTAFSGRATTRESVNGLDLVLEPEFGVACVVDGRQALFGTEAAVRDGLDAKANSTGMDRSERYLAARNALAGEQLATVYVDGEAIETLMPDGPDLPMPSGDLPLPSGVPLPALDGLDALAGLDGLLPGIPEWAITGLRAEDDALVVDSVAAPIPAPTGGPSLLPLPAVHDSVVAGLAPADTLLLIEDQGTGVSLQNLLIKLRTIPELAGPLGMLDGMGGTDELVGWIDDVGVIVTGGDSPQGGLLLVAETEAAATQRLQTLTSLLGLAGMGGGLEVRETTVAGVAVTTVVITDLGALVPPGTLPGEVPTPAAGPIEISFAVRDRVLYLGSGEAFMEKLLGAASGGRLVDQDAYRRAAAYALDGSRTSIYVGVPAIIDLVEPLLPPEELREWQANVAPYAEPFEAVTVSVANDPAGPRSRVVISVRPR